MAMVQMLSRLAFAAARVAPRRLRRGPMRPTWTWGFEIFMESFRRASHRLYALPPVQQGAAAEQMAVPHPVLRKVRFEPTSAGSVPAEWPLDGHGNATVLYLHGGGYSSLSVRNYRELLARTALGARARILAVEYRLAPAHPFPAAIEDALAAWQWLRASGVDPSRTIVAGDSCGAALACALLLSLRDAGEPMPAASALISPWVDLSAHGGSLRENAPYDWWTPEDLARRIPLYLGDRDPKTLLASPGLADLHGLPPMLVQVGSAEIVLDQAQRLAERARAAGVEVSLEITPDMVHNWHFFAAVCPASRRAIDRLCDFIGARTDARTSTS